MVMKRLLAAVLLILPVTSMADHLDAIETKLKDGCAFSNYLEIVRDFNEWGKGHGYKAEVLMPIQRASLESFFWVGQSANAGVFGKAWDAWRDAQANSDSVPAKLWARLEACSTNVSRSGYDTY